MKLHFTALFVALAVFVVGCGEDVSTQDISKLTNITSQQPKKEENQINPSDFPSPSGDPSSADPSAAPPQSAPQQSASIGYGGVSQPAAPDETYGQGAPIKLKSQVDNPDLAKAEGGVGKRGQGYGGGIITEPIRQRFIIEDRIKFMNMQNTLKIYKAGNNDKNPATVKQFIDEIVTATGITLPELPRGHFYVYDPSAKNIDDILWVDQSQTQ
jgi:hypothetical protein